MSRRGFTLAELLISIAIIAILTAILVPVLGSAKRKGKDTVCLSNMRQLGLAFQLYVERYDDRMPDRWSRIHPAFTGDARIFLCPLDRGKGQYEDTGRLEGSAFLPSGVSYTWTPNWEKALEWGWWQPWPDVGGGKWLELTPISECHWQWASRYGQIEGGDQIRTARYPAHLLLYNGSVVKWPGRMSVEHYSPDP